MTELGEIPNNWEVKKLDEISNITRLAGAEYSDIWETDDNGTIIALKGNNIGKNNLILNDIERITEEMSNRLIRSKLFKNDIVFPCVGTIGKATVINEDNKYHINQNIAKITPSSGINSLYLSYYLMSDFTVKEIFKYNTSSSQPNVLVGNLRKFNIIVPSTEEQEKIASILSIVDEQIDNVDALIEKNKELKKGLMQTLLTKGIGHTKFKKTEIGEIPEEWEVRRLEDICDDITIGMVKTMTKFYVDNGVPLIRNSDIKENTIKTDSMVYLDKEFSRANQSKCLNIGQIVTVHTGDIGTSAVIEENMQGAQGFATLNTTVNKSIINEYYLCWYLNSDICKNQAYSFSTGDGRNNLNLKDFVNILAIVPSSIEEQKKIVFILNSISRKIQEYENKKQKLEELKKGLMQQLLSGRIRVK